ncbi:MAG TPA: hypothetical protein VNV14_00045, partial [Opitutaceae bacterium]|nr:hypothetical protein [Opitutaceae bacterium]
MNFRQDAWFGNCTKKMCALCAHIFFVQITNAILRSSGATNGTADSYFGFFSIVILYSSFLLSAFIRVIRGKNGRRISLF